MIFPPSLVRLEHDRHCFWIPIFLLWPLLLLAWLLAGLCAAVALLVFSPRGLPQIFNFWGGLARVFCELRGTRVGVQAQRSGFNLTVY
jgi:hypothetical protein